MQIRQDSSKLLRFEDSKVSYVHSIVNTKRRHQNIIGGGLIEIQHIKGVVERPIERRTAEYLLHSILLFLSNL